jgi:release factor glutamine methyltransferase
VAGQVWTILSVIQWTTDYFKKKDLKEARATAEILLGHVLGLERIQLYLNFDKPLSPSELAAYRQCIQRRSAGEPVQYITGRQEFWSLTFKVTPAALIPRPETELLVEEGTRLLKNVEQPRILELGVGCGAISIALAKKIGRGSFIATDISLPALFLAQENRDRLGETESIALVCCNLFQAFHPHPEFHLIVSNPPYVTSEEYANLPREIKEFEPKSALNGGKDGLTIIRGIIGEAHSFLLSGGHIMLEIGEQQGAAVLEFTQRLGVYDEVRVLRDYAGKERVLKASKIQDEKRLE